MKNIKIIIIIIFITVILSLPASALAATLSLSPATGTFNRSCNFTLTIALDTQGAQTDGTDAVLRFDPTRVSATKINPGVIYPDYPGTNIDSTGKITISGLASVNQAFSGTGTLATIDFTVPSGAPTGAAALTFEFDPNDLTKTTDSNVVERSTVKDVLSSVTNGNYTIGSGSCSSQTATPGNQGGGTPGSSEGSLNKGGGTSGSTESSVAKTLPPAGTEQLTFTLAIIGSVLTMLGILGLALL